MALTTRQDYRPSISHHLCCVCWVYAQVAGPTVWSRLRTTEFLRNFSSQFYLLSEVLAVICWEQISEKILFVLCFDVWPGARTHYLLEHGFAFWLMCSFFIFVNSSCIHTYIIGYYIGIHWSLYNKTAVHFACQPYFGICIYYL